jgi:transcriptional regulator with XRE-family HTH domain
VGGHVSASFTRVRKSYTLVKMRLELAEELRQARRARSLSLEAAGRAAKISQGYLHKLEAGRVENPSPRVLQRLSGVLEVPYGRLMELADYMLPAGDSGQVRQQKEETTVMTAATAPTNQELARLLSQVLETLAEIKRDQKQLAQALERLRAA